MLIRKQFKFEGAHIVRDCSSTRCKSSIHGHSYIVEVFFTSKGIDNGGMVMDFGLMKDTIGQFIDSFDHCYSIWTKEKPEFKNFIKEQSERWIEMPVTPSAEMYSLMFFYVINKIIWNTEFKNGENHVHLHSVRVHETQTGWAESFKEDLTEWYWPLEQIIISEPIKQEWKDPEMWDKLQKGIKFQNPVVELKYQ